MSRYTFVHYTSLRQGYLLLGARLICSRQTCCLQVRHSIYYPLWVYVLVLNTTPNDNRCAQIGPHAKCILGVCWISQRIWVLFSTALHTFISEFQTYRVVSGTIKLLDSEGLVFPMNLSKISHITSKKEFNQLLITALHILSYCRLPTTKRVNLQNGINEFRT